MRKIGFALLSLVFVVVLAGPSAAQSATDLDAIANELASSGRYLEFSSNGDLDDSIDEANGRGIAFAWVDTDGDAEDLAFELSERLQSSSYRTTLVLTNTGVGAWSPTLGGSEIQGAVDSSGDDFAGGAVASGVDRFTASLAGQTTATTTNSGGTSSDTSSGGGFGFGSFLVVALLGGGGFMLFRNLRGKSKSRKEAANDLEADRAEIKEQLRDNADHVLNLGDRVISEGKSDLISTYEQASAAYQDVSQSVDAATTAEEIDRLDDKIDKAEWQFESIEAELEGRPAPPSPEEVEAQAEAAATPPPGPTAPSPSNDRPALGADDSVFSGRSGPQSRQPRSRQPRYQQPRNTRRRGGGGLGGTLGSILGSIVLGGGGLGGLGGSRRTQQRRGTTSRSGGALGGGGLGGGVLRRGNNRTSSQRRGSGGSRSIGRRGGGGGRRF